MANEIITANDEIHPGVRQYALGMGLVMAPDAMSKVFCPELFDGIEDDKKARAVIVESSRLTLQGLSKVLEHTRVKLGFNNIADLRPVRERLRVIPAIQAEFDKLYSGLDEGQAGQLQELPKIFREVRHNPLSDGALMSAFTHHKNELSLDTLAGPLPVPFWIRDSGLMKTSFKNLDIGLRSHK